MKSKSKSPVPPMLPRERLTKKALAAISEYASIRADNLYIHYKMVRYVLEAERMRRADLYTWLGERGYRWNGVYWGKAKAKTGKAEAGQ